MKLGRSSDVRVLLAELKACRSIESGKLIHAEAKRSGHDSSLYVANALISMFSRSGSMFDAQQVFDGIKHPDVVSWNALILGYAVNGQGATGLDLFRKMRYQGHVPNTITFLAALKACTSLASKHDGWEKADYRKQGGQIHSLASEAGCDSDTRVKSALIDMYAKCGSMAEARTIFDSMKQADVVSWNALILGYASNGEDSTALGLFRKMRCQSCPPPDSRTYVAALKACTSLALDHDQSGRTDCGEWGRKIHSLAMQDGCDSDRYVRCSLIDMYAKSGSMLEARAVFNSMEHPDVVSWTALILGYAEFGEARTALDAFETMRSKGCAPNSVTLVAAIKACTALALDQSRIGRAECRERGAQLHLLASDIGCGSATSVQNALLDMYAKCGSMAEAQRIFDCMEQPDVVSWNSLILGYAMNGEGVAAFDRFMTMKSQGCKPDFITFLAAFKACSLLGALEAGRKIHAEVNMAEPSVVLVTALVDFYAKCGSMFEAQYVFDMHCGTRDMTTWCALLGGYARLGDVQAAFALFQRMQDAGYKPNAVTFTCILTCCSHAGLVEKGKEFFDSMTKTYGIVPSIEHYTSMIDILGRSNKLDDAMALLQSMPCSPNAVTWMTVLAACRKWNNLELGKLAFKSLVSLDDTNAAAYMLMARIYGSRGMQEEQDLLLERRRKLRISKMPGQSWWVNEAGQLHLFLVGN